MTVKTICSDCNGTGEVIYPPTGKKIRCQSCAGKGFKITQASDK